MVLTNGQFRVVYFPRDYENKTPFDQDLQILNAVGSMYAMCYEIGHTDLPAMTRIVDRVTPKYVSSRFIIFWSVLQWGRVTMLGPTRSFA